MASWRSLRRVSVILPEFFDTCDFCDEPFEQDTTYPVLTTADDEGSMELYSFCDDECLSAWHDGDRAMDERDGGGAKA